MTTVEEMLAREEALWTVIRALDSALALTIVALDRIADEDGEAAAKHSIDPILDESRRARQLAATSKYRAIPVPTKAGDL